MSKRGNGAGTVIEDPKGSGKWWAKLPAGPDGKRPKRLAASKEDAEALLRQMHAARDAGRDLSRKAVTVKDLVAAYTESIRGQHRPSTQRNTRSRVAHITGAIGAMKVEAVTIETTQALANKLVKNVSPNVALAVLQLLHGAYETVIPERVSRNPVDWKKLKLRKGKPAESIPLGDAEIRALVVAADDQQARGANYRYAIFVWLIAFTGMRRAEAAGATWRDVDWTKSEIRVRTQIGLDEDGTYKPGQDLKTPESVRLIPLGPRLLARLRQHWNFLQAERKLRGTNWKEYGVVVCDENGEPIRQLNRLNGRLERLGKIACITQHVHPHLLRHTLATAIGDEGYSEAVIAAILGHSQGKNITLRYTHAHERMKRAAMLAVEDRILGAADAAREAL